MPLKKIVVLSRLSRPSRVQASPLSSWAGSTARPRQSTVANPWIAKRTLTTNSSRSASTATATRPATNVDHFPKSTYKSLPTSSQTARQVVINWDAGTRSQFHNIWLRDHCRCPECFHPDTKQREFATSEIPRDITPIRVESKASGLQVTWFSSEEPHISEYPWSWLQRNSYDPQLGGLTASNDKKVLWGSKVKQEPLTVTYEEVMSADDRGLFKWLSNVSTFGLSFVTGVPVDPDASEELSKRIGFTRETQYGKLWELMSDLSVAGDTAYSNVALGAHTDNTYFTDPTGLMMFHLLSHTEGTGGLSLLVDGFNVAAQVKKNHPEAYELLSTVRVPAHSAGQTDALYCPSPATGYPVLGHDAISGELSALRWNNDDRSVMNHLAPEIVEKWYDAIRVWHKYLTSPENEYWLQLQPGTAVVIDNHRVLHGRSSFTGKRRMCGTYIGIDEYKSKWAVMRERFTTDAGGNVVARSERGRSVWNAYL